MKSFLYLCSILLFFSCSSKQTIIDPVSKKEIKVYENDEFSFHYPKNWRILRSGFNYGGDVLQLSPSKLVKSGYRLGSSVPNTNSLKNQNIIKPQNEVKFSSVTMNLYQEEIGDTTKLKDFISEKVKKVTNENSKLVKQSEGHYIFYTTVQHPKAGNVSTIQHYIRKNSNTVQILSFMSDLSNYIDYLKDAQMVFSSFEFKDEKTDLKSDLAPEKQLLLKEL